MIELMSMTINHYNNVIETRNKVFRLGQDLNFRINVVTRLSTLVSEILAELLKENEKAEMKITFSKKKNHYYLNVLIFCTQQLYDKYRKFDVFSSIKFAHLEDGKDYINLRLKISDLDFIPNTTFIETERERLIQQSNTEMIHEIRRKNKELTKALQDVKASTNLIQVEKMRALGGMTAGVAHELNNPMMGILNFIQYAIKHTDEDDRKYRPLVDAEREVKRCQDIISNLLTFSRMKAEGEEEYSEIKLSMLCERIIKLQTYKINSNGVVVSKDILEDEPRVKMKVNKVQQVILNLVSNAIDSMKEKEKKNLNFKIDRKDSKMNLAVIDTGQGMDEETIDKIFEPFFTTKRTGEGTGLGLAVSQSIIEEHGGSLTCESTPEVGTCFNISLPLKETEEDKNE